MIKIVYYDIPPGANGDYTAQGQSQPFWDGTLLGDEGTAAATLEPGEWRLDGTCGLLDGREQPGFWSREVSGESGTFDQPVTLTLRFGGRYTSTGLTLFFDRTGDLYCRRMRVTWYRGQNLLAQGEYLGESAVLMVNREVEAFDSIQLEFLELNRPGRFLKLNRLLVGVQEEFGWDELQDCRMMQETDVLSTRLSGSTLDFTLNEQKGRILRFQKRQPVEVWQNEQKLGRFYLKDSCKTQRNVYQLSALDVVGILADSQWEGGLYRKMPFPQLVEEILAGECEFSIDAALSEERLSGWLPAGSKRDGLLQAAFAAGAMVVGTTEGGIRFLSIPQYADRILTEKEIFTGGSITTKAVVTSVSLLAHDYVEGTTMETIAESTVEAEEMTIRTKKPCTGYLVQGGTILRSGANFVTVRANGGSLVVQARPYQEITRALVWNNPKATAGDQSNQLEINEATLVDWARAEKVLERVSCYAENRQELKQTVVGAGPEPGQMVTSVMPFDGQLVGYVTGRELRLNGNAVAELTLTGRSMELEAVNAGYCGVTESGVNGWS